MVEFREVWPLIHKYVHDKIKTCCFEGCDAPIQDIYHMWQNHTSVHVRLRCANDHYDWHELSLYTLYQQLPKQHIEPDVGVEITAKT